MLNPPSLLINSQYWATPFCLFETELVLPHFIWENENQSSSKFDSESCNMLDSNCQSNTNVAAEVYKVAIKKTSGLIVNSQVPIHTGRLGGGGGGGGGGR